MMGMECGASAPPWDAGRLLARAECFVDGREVFLPGSPGLWFGRTVVETTHRLFALGGQGIAVGKQIACVLRERGRHFLGLGLGRCRRLRRLARGVRRCGCESGADGRRWDGRRRGGSRPATATLPGRARRFLHSGTDSPAKRVDVGVAVVCRESPKLGGQLSFDLSGQLRHLFARLAQFNHQGLDRWFVRHGSPSCQSHGQRPSSHFAMKIEKVRVSPARHRPGLVAGMDKAGRLRWAAPPSSNGSQFVTKSSTTGVTIAAKSS